MDYGRVETQKNKHPAWRLLAADHAPLIISFLHTAFIRPNLRTASQADLAIRLDDYLYAVRAQIGSDHFPKRAEEYLEDWASDERAYLRKYYPPDSDIPHFDITPAAERAIDWVASLEQRSFVGTESRLMTVFELLRQIVEGTESDPRLRIAELERQRARLDEAIERVRRGNPDLLDDTSVKERFFQLAGTARAILSDFREVEQNFRDLDRAVRERIATWDGGKGELLEEIFGEREAIAGSDQGKSFHAFWDFIMSPARQEEFSKLLAAAFSLQPIRDLAPDERLLRIHFDWLSAGESAQRTVARLSEQLRRYLDDKAWLENKRIMQLLREIEQNALAHRLVEDDAIEMHIDALSPSIQIPMERVLFSPPLNVKFDSEIHLGDGKVVPFDELFNQVYIDKERLSQRISTMLFSKPEVTLEQILAAHPLEQGLAELVTYFVLATDRAGSIIDDSKPQTVEWVDDVGRPRRAAAPRIIFTRRAVSVEPVGEVR